MYDRVLLPTDGSAPAARATPHAISHAAQYDADLHVIFVIEQTESAAIVGQEEAAREAIEAEGESAIETIREEAADAGVHVEGVIREGDPHQEILGYAEEESVDLVVMSTHGRSGVGRVIVGSVTERVLRNGDVPVLAVRR